MPPLHPARHKAKQGPYCHPDGSTPSSTWTATSGKERLTEDWRRAGDATFEGEGSTWSIESGERTGSESLRLAAMSSGVYYIAKVAHNPLPVPFAFKEERQVGGR